MRLQAALRVRLVALSALCVCLVVGGGLLACRSEGEPARPTPTPVATPPQAARTPSLGLRMRRPTPTAAVATPTPPSPSPTPAPRPSTPPPPPPPPGPGGATAPAPGLTLRMAIPVENVITIVPVPDGRLALFTVNGQTGFLDLLTGNIAEGLTAPEAIEDLVFSPDGRAFALLTASGVRVWDILEGATRFVLTPEQRVRRIAFSPQGTLLLVGGVSVLSGYFVETGEEAFAFDLMGPADEFVMMPDEGLIFQMTWMAPDIQVWDTYSGEWRGSIQFDPLTAMALSADGVLLAVAENEVRPSEAAYRGVAPFPTTVTIWKTTVRPEEQDVRLDLLQRLQFVPETELGKFPLPLRELAFTPDGRRLVGLADWIGEGDMNGRLYVWDVASGRMMAREVLPPRPWRMALAEGGRAVAVLIGGGPFGREVRIYEIP